MNVWCENLRSIYKVRIYVWNKNHFNNGLVNCIDYYVWESCVHMDGHGTHAVSAFMFSMVVYIPTIVYCLLHIVVNIIRMEPGSLSD